MPGVPKRSVDPILAWRKGPSRSGSANGGFVVLPAVRIVAIITAIVRVIVFPDSDALVAVWGTLASILTSGDTSPRRFGATR